MVVLGTEGKMLREVCPAPLMSPDPVIGFRPVTGYDTHKFFAEQFFDHDSSLRQPNPKDRERGTDDRPDPGVLILLLRGGFIGADSLLFGNRFDQFRVRFFQ